MSNKIIYVLHVTEPTELICEQRRLINDGFEIIDVQVTNSPSVNWVNYFIKYRRK